MIESTAIRASFILFFERNVDTFLYRFCFKFGCIELQSLLVSICPRKYGSCHDVDIYHKKLRGGTSSAKTKGFSHEYFESDVAIVYRYPNLGNGNQT